jgi:hypothetical protein
VLKVNKQNLIMEEVEQFDKISIEDLAEGVSITASSDSLALNTDARPELPENAPRFIILSYEYDHKDGRKSFPLVLVNWAPKTTEIGLLTLHASAFLDFQATVRSYPVPMTLVLIFRFDIRFHRSMFGLPLDKADVSKVVEVRDPEEFTKETVDARLALP